MHEMWMKRALALAKKGWGATNPNPLVGAVIVKNGKMVGEGYHSAYGEPHAEVVAIEDAGEESKNATLYVTLEPCSHYGKTPPCTEAIIKAGIKKVYAALLDPNPKVAGTGFKKLNEAGIETYQGLLHQEATEVNDIFIHFITTEMPFVIHKTAMSLDGKTASNSGHSQWITGEEARRHAHWLRQRVASIMVGVGTVVQDDPSLNVRGIDVDALHPVRIIVDSRGRIPLSSKVLNDTLSTKTIIATTEQMRYEIEQRLIEKGVEVFKFVSDNGRVSLKALLKELGNRRIDSVLIEGGGILAASAFESKLVDKVMYYLAPKIIGGTDATGVVMGKGIQHMDEAITLKDMKCQTIGSDLLISAMVNRER